MYKITFYNNDIDRIEELEFKTLKEALKVFQEIDNTPYWEADIESLTLTREVKEND